MCTASAAKPVRKTRMQTVPPQNSTSTAPADVPVEIWRIRRVENNTGLKKSMIYLLKSRGDFPESVKLSRYSTGWFRHEVEAWIRSRPLS
jgi:prophage regulatory protein